MRKLGNLIKKSSFFIICIAIIISSLILMFSKKSEAIANRQMNILNIWQIDSFEGGKGSRSAYLQNLGNKFTKQENCYIIVTAISAEAAKKNIDDGNIPDLISYGAGICGIENIFYGKTPFYNWCNGGYCFLTLAENSDFSDICESNTIINSGTENYSEIAALLSGIPDAEQDKPTGAYVKLINGKYKYLLGTQRDVFRLKTREVTFSVKPITEFNDLYQNISITKECHNFGLAQKFIEFILNNDSNINSLGLMKSGKLFYDDEMRIMEGLEYNYKIISPISEGTRDSIKDAVTNKDLNLIKNLLK